MQPAIRSRLTAAIMEIRCFTLTAPQLRGELEFFSELLAETGERVIAFFGWGCDVEQDEMYVDIELETDVLAFIAECEAQGQLTLGGGNVSLRTADDTIEVLLCHESDVHVRGPERLLDRVRNRWSRMGYGAYEVAGQGHS